MSTEATISVPTEPVHVSGSDLPKIGNVRLTVENLRICLKGTSTDVVDEVSFEVGEGDILGLVGESGSGKTTVALALLAYARRGLSIESGKVVLDGVDLLSLRPKELRAIRGSRVSYVPQDPASALNPALTIGTQLEEAIRAHPGAAENVPERVREVLEETRLSSNSHFLKRYPHEFSGGQLQRVAIAMAFACRPSLIVLDEPTTGLDVSTQRHLLDTIRRLCTSHGVAAVYVSHDLAVVAGLVTSVAVMYAGRQVEVGPIERVFRAPMHPYTRGLLAAIPSIERSERLQGIEGRPPRPGRRPSGCSFAPRCSFVEARCSEPPPIVAVNQSQVRCWRPVVTGERVAANDRSLPDRTPSDARVLTASNLVASYGPVEVLHGVSLEVPPQTCVAVVGESGSGKTTLARCIVGLHENWSGELRFGDTTLPPSAHKRPKDALKRVQYIFQNPYTSLNPRKTIGQIISQPLEHFFELGQSERERRIMAVLEDVSLSPEVVDKYPDQLSGGERQRVAIARALVVEPDLLVCDEVTSSLDVSVQAVIIELLRRLQDERNIAMIFITHNLALVRSIAQSVIVLSEGKIVEAGTVADVLEHPREEYTIGLMRDVPRLSAAPPVA